MTTKAEIGPRLPLRRGLGEADAALYVGLGVSKFVQMVKEGTMPKPRLAGTRKLWDVDELDIAFKSLPREGESEPDTWGDFRGRNHAQVR